MHPRRSIIHTVHITHSDGLARNATTCVRESIIHEHTRGPHKNHRAMLRQDFKATGKYTLTERQRHPVTVHTGVPHLYPLKLTGLRVRFLIPVQPANYFPSSRQRVEKSASLQWCCTTLWSTRLNSQALVPWQQSHRMHRLSHDGPKCSNTI